MKPRASRKRAQVVATAPVRVEAKAAQPSSAVAMGSEFRLVSVVIGGSAPISSSATIGGASCTLR